MSGGKCTLRVLDAGMGISFQDFGRPGWRRFGVPQGGAMDPFAAARANHLLGNPPETVVLELLMNGACFEVIEDSWFAVAGADTGGLPAVETAVQVRAGEQLRFPAIKRGVWSYLAVPGGWLAPRWFGSVSCNARAGLGEELCAGSVLESARVACPFPSGISKRWQSAGELPNFEDVLRLRVMPGPQWERFSSEARERFVGSRWEVSARSDRSGYRLSGPQLSGAEQIPSEPVLPGSIQVPHGGQPIVIMPDGPTVGGYPQIGVLGERDLARLAQCPPGMSIEFAWEQ